MSEYDFLPREKRIVLELIPQCHSGESKELTTPSSSTSTMTFKKRSGTTDVGKEYEVLVMANIAFSLLNDDSVNDFLVWGNDNNFGAFDDLIIETSKIKCAVQLKHSMQKKKTINLNQFLGYTGDFSIQKYLNSFQENRANLSDYKLILFTNRLFEPEVGKTVTIPLCKYKNREIHLQICKPSVSPLPGIDINHQNCFQFQILPENSTVPEDVQDFFEKFFLYTNQSHVKTIEKYLPNQIKKKFSCRDEVPEKFLHIFREWNLLDGTKDKLSKPTMQQQLALCLVSPYIHPFSFGGSKNKNYEILQKAILKFHVTVCDKERFERFRDISDKSKTCLNIKELGKDASIINRNYQLTNDDHLSEKAFSKLLWLMDKSPLIVDENTEVHEAIKLCEKKSFIVLTSNLQQNFKYSKIFQKLSDLQIHEHIFKDLVDNFQFLIASDEIDLSHIVSLQQLIEQDRSFLDSLTVSDLLKLSEVPYYVIPLEKEKISDHYIPRLLSINYVSFKYLETVDESTLIFIDSVEKIEAFALKLKRFNLIQLEDREKEETKHTSSCSPEVLKLYVSAKKCSSEDFREIVATNPGKVSYHHFRFVVEENLEWLKTNSPVDDLQQFRSKRTAVKNESSFYQQDTGNNINLISGDSGMGKSELLKHLKNNYKLRTVTLFLEPKIIEKLAGCASMHGFIDMVVDLKFNQHSSFDKKVLKLYIKEGKAAFFWDALDEVSSKTLDAIVRVIREVVNTGCVQWLSCRTNLKARLQRKLSVLARRLCQFDENDQTEYLRLRLPNITLELITKIQNSLWTIKQGEVLETPLQIFMVAEVMSQNLETDLEVLDSVMILTDLYQKFLEKKFDDFFRERARIDQSNQSSRKILRTYKNTICEKYQEAALLLLAANVSNKFNIRCDKFLLNIQEEKDDIGLITEIQDEKVPRFLHISWAEYFVAKFFVDQAHEILQFKEFLFSEKNTNVRLFFDLLMSNSSEHRAVLYKDIDLLKTSARNLNELRDEGGRTLLHFACAWGQRYPPLAVQQEESVLTVDDTNDSIITPETEEYKEVLSYLLQKSDPTQKDDLLQETPLNYARNANCLFAQLKTLQKLGKGLFQSTNREVVRISARPQQLRIENIEEDSEHEDFTVAANILYYSVKLGYDEAFDCCRHVPYIKTKRDNLSILHLAVKFDRENFLRRLLNIEIYREKINERNTHGETILFKACEYGRTTLLPLLLMNGANRDIARNDGWSVLHIACHRGHLEIVAKLVEDGENIKEAANDDTTPLHVACSSEQVEIVEFLLSKGAEANGCKRGGWTPLHVAAEQKSENCVELLLSHKAEVNKAAENGNTPLHQACQKGHLGMCQVLLDRGADSSKRGHDGAAPLHVACQYGHVEVVKLLIANNNRIDCVDDKGRTPLFVACQNGYEEIAGVLIDNGASVDRQTSDGKTPLHAACEKQNENIIGLLLSKNANFVPDNSGDTPLHLVCKNGSDAIVEIFLNHPQVQVDQKAQDLACQHGHISIVQRFLPFISQSLTLGKTTPLHTACRYGQYETLEVLLTSQIPQVSDKNGQTPLHIACREGHVQIAELLIAKDAQVNATDNEGNSPLHLAAREGRLACVKLLLDKNADVNAVTGNGSSATKLASRNGHDEVVKVLSEFRSKGVVSKYVPDVERDRASSS